MEQSRIKITESDIRTLGEEARAHGDYEQYKLCKQALEGDESALRLCYEAILSAIAMEES